METLTKEAFFGAVREAVRPEFDALEKSLECEMKGVNGQIKGLEGEISGFKGYNDLKLIILLIMIRNTQLHSLGEKAL